MVYLKGDISHCSRKMALAMAFPWILVASWLYIQKILSENIGAASSARIRLIFTRKDIAKKPSADTVLFLTSKVLSSMVNLTLGLSENHRRRGSSRRRCFVKSHKSEIRLKIILPFGRYIATALGVVSLQPNKPRDEQILSLSIYYTTFQGRRTAELYDSVLHEQSERGSYRSHPDCSLTFKGSIFVLFANISVTLV